MTRTCRCPNCFLSPHLLLKLLQSQDDTIRRSALSTLLHTAHLRGKRDLRAEGVAGTAIVPADGPRTIFDCRNGVRLNDTAVVRTETGPPSADAAVNRAFEGLGATRDFYRTVFKRNSIDGNGMRLDGYVHRDRLYNNAFWDGQEMVFGDGDGVVFSDFTGSLDVIAHELTHGVTERTAGLTYHNQAGALNESMSDVFASLVKQWRADQTAEAADWLIGAELFTPRFAGEALRSLKAPGTAYDNPEMGRDPQPDHMDRYLALPDTEEGDNGGVHYNSGIPNRAFYLTAMNIAGKAWEAPGLIWYEALKASSATTDFQEFADTTFVKAGQLFGLKGVEQQAVAAGWAEVGITIAPPGAARARAVAEPPTPAPPEPDAIASLARKVEALSERVSALARELTPPRGGAGDGAPVDALADLPRSPPRDGPRRLERAPTGRRDTY